MEKHIKLILLVILLVFSGLVSFGQPPDNRQDKVENLRIAFYTKELGLSTEEAKNFWPVYNLHQKELRFLKKDFKMDMMEAQINFDNMTEGELSKIIDQYTEYQQKEVDILKKYTVEYRKVIPTKKIVLMYRAEKKFRRYLLNVLKGDRD